MYNSRRLEKVASLLKKEISLIIMYQLDNNLILENFVSITKVEITADMQYCKILINSSANETTKNQIVEQLNVNKNKIRYYLSQKISMKRVPELIFKKDKFFDEGLSVLKVLDELRSIDDDKKNL
tara:strand:+ start:226 stop:600 length:375 start_codon:yes stop_codon:yes gene_type:complete